ncbi:MAG TPA: NUDIX domain-containing protein [Prolixibacteraceae bacterium]|nr:NUDIX domain-containing protein [Prolixibacteraceae bacterium]
MYKVFFNDSTIQLSTELKKSSKNNIVKVVGDESYVFVNQIVSETEKGGEVSDSIIINQEVNQLWDYFRSLFVEIPAAGGLVRNENGLFLFIRRLGVWDLPKGKIEKNETPELAAVREVEEECGLSGLKIVRQLDSTFHIYRSPYLTAPKNLVLKETKWFLMAYSGNETLVPQTEEEIVDVQWIPVHEFGLVMENTYSSLRDLFNKTMPLI